MPPQETMIQNKRIRKSELLSQEFSLRSLSNEDKACWVKDICLKHIVSKSEFLGTVIAGIDTVKIVPHVFCSSGAQLITLNEDAAVSLVNELQVSEGLLSTICDCFFKGQQTDGLTYLKSAIKGAVRFNFIRFYNESSASEEDPARLHAINLLRKMSDKDMFVRLDSMIEDGFFYEKEADDMHHALGEKVARYQGNAKKVVSLNDYRNIKPSAANAEMYEVDESVRPLENISASL